MSITTNKVVKCQKCGNEIGRVIEINDVQFLHAGGQVIGESKGVCCACGAPFFWSINNQRLERLLKTIAILE
jgi:hypothetical protein